MWSRTPPPPATYYNNKVSRGTGKGSKGTGKGSKGTDACSKDEGDDCWNYIKEGNTVEVEGTFDKKTGKKYPCAHCNVMFGHREMLISRREQHKMEWEGPPESLSPEAKGKKEVRYKRVCEECEMVLRTEEGLGGAVDRWEIRKEIRRQYRGDQWGARGKFYQQAVREVELEKGLSKEEKAKRKTAKCKELAEDFILVLQNDGLMMLFSEAGTKIRQM